MSILRVLKNLLGERADEMGCLTGDCPHNAQSQCNDAVALYLGEWVTTLRAENARLRARLRQIVHCTSGGRTPQHLTMACDIARAALADTEGA